MKRMKKGAWIKFTATGERRFAYRGEWYLDGNGQPAFAHTATSFCEYPILRRTTGKARKRVKR